MIMLIIIARFLNFVMAATGLTTALTNPSAAWACRQDGCC